MSLNVGCLTSSELIAKASVWLPPKNDALVDSSELIHKIQKIECNHEKPNYSLPTISPHLRSLYRRFFKKIKLLRWLILTTWNAVVFVYRKLILFRNRNGGFPIVKLKDFVEKNGENFIQIFEPVTVSTPVPKAYPESDGNFLVSPHDSYTFPGMYIAELTNVTAYGGTNIIFVDNVAVCHDLYDFNRDFTSEEVHFDHFIDVKRNRLHRKSRKVSSDKIEKAASFLDACASNYAHWLTEVLPRIAVFCSQPQFSRIPIIVDENLHHNIMESIFALVGPERKIITVSKSYGIHVEKLYVTSVAGYVPFERRNSKLQDHSHGIFNPLALEVLQTRFYHLRDKMPLEAWPKKIYLRRTSGIRKVSNLLELENFLISQGYAIVEPERLNFLQQVSLFSHAEEVLSSSGAALANLVFSPPNTITHVLIGKLSGTSYWYWQNMACASGKKISYVLGDLTGIRFGIHSDFTVSLEEVNNSLGVKQ